MAVVHKYNAAW